ncbi:MAG: hypothetical protein AAB913_02880 [Patescibacteria group bacterium]
MSTLADEFVYWDGLFLPNFPTSDDADNKTKKVVVKNYDASLVQVILAKKMHPGAEKVCPKCSTPIYEDGAECPNCDE